jgi:hypothetical protein
LAHLLRLRRLLLLWGGVEVQVNLPLMIAALIVILTAIAVRIVVICHFFSFCDVKGAELSP